MIAPATIRIGSLDPPAEESLPWPAVGGIGPERLRTADYVVVQPGPRTLRPVLLRLHAMDPAVQIILAPERERRREVERALLFTPGVGEVWVAAPEELGEALFTRAAEVTRTRRSSKETRAGVREGMERLGGAEVDGLRAATIERRRISDEFLAALLGVVPHPVLSLDADGLVVSANPAAERLLGREGAELEGAGLTDLLRPEEPGRLVELLEQGQKGRARGELGFSRSDGERGTAEVSVVPVRAGAYRVRCVVLHDVTESRRIRTELEDRKRLLEEEATERERVNHALVRKTKELERALQSRSRFYAAMSHELRTPLNAIIGYQSLLLDGMFGELADDVAQPLRRARSAASHLLDLVQDVLDLSRIESGRIALEPQPVEFPTLLHELGDTIGPLAANHGSRLEIEGPEESHAIVTDPRRLRQILLNLLSNAVKFGEGHPVRAAWSVQEGGGVSISVEDRGRGIPAARLREIFEEFVQFDESDESTGSGLGLTISRRLAEAIGAELEVESEVGRGSAFRVRLPPRIDPKGRGLEPAPSQGDESTPK